jgi:hypothetical protein
MLNLEEMKQADHETRKRIVADHLAEEIPPIVRKYKFKDFDEPCFTEDLKNWLSEWPSLKHTRVKPANSSMRESVDYMRKYGAWPRDKTSPGWLAGFARSAHQKYQRGVHQGVDAPSNQWPKKRDASGTLSMRHLKILRESNARRVFCIAGLRYHSVQPPLLYHPHP